MFHAFLLPQKRKSMKENLPIGNLIRQELKRQDSSIAWLARKVDYPPGRMYKILKRDHLDTALIYNISKVLEYDFFAHYSAFLRDQLPDTIIGTPANEVIEQENLLIGALIHQKLKERDHSTAWLSRKIYCSQSTLGKIWEREHIDAALLWDISKVLRYDFFAHYSAWLKA